jgi:catechol 2,3-dioxygenase-like lactoylglutathione lyase family enzyme
MFDHVTIRVGDRQAAERFYATVLSAAGIAQTAQGENFTEWDDFSLAAADDDHPATSRLHVAFAAPSREAVDAFWRAGIDAGARDDGAPGPRPQYLPDYYGGFLLDPDGNSAEAVHYEGMRSGGKIDHLWVRVADVATSRSFYETIAPHASIRLGTDSPERVSFNRDGGSLSLVAGEPSRHVHLAFSATDDGTVEAFHHAATKAGYRDNGAPGERPEYHAGYYAAFVLDPDGNNVEVVNHNRPKPAA